jgi:hypothetical protein
MPDGADERDRALQGRHAGSVVGHAGWARRARAMRQDRRPADGESDLSSAADGRRLRPQAARLLQFPRLRREDGDGDARHAREAHLHARAGHAARFLPPERDEPLPRALDAKGMPSPGPTTTRPTTVRNPRRISIYGIPNQAIRYGKVPTHVPTGPWRSVEASWHGFFIESFIDELAHAANMDPVAYRLQLLADKPRHAVVVAGCGQAPAGARRCRKGKARGIAMVECFETIVAHVAEIEVGRTARSKSTASCRRSIAAWRSIPTASRRRSKAASSTGCPPRCSARSRSTRARSCSELPGLRRGAAGGMPEIEVHIVESGAALGGAGEPGTPPIAPAVTNAIFAATGIRVRELPLKNVSLASSRPQSARL